VVALVAAACHYNTARFITLTMKRRTWVQDPGIYSVIHLLRNRNQRLESA